MNKIESLYEDFLQNRAKQRLKRDLVDLTRPSAREISVNGQKFINFSSNDYLGLSKHPLLIERAQEWAEQYGAGSGASRLVTGNLEIFTRIENKVAALKEKEAALIMASGFQANASVLPALFDKEALGEEPLIFSDKLNHASMYLGCAAANIKNIRYRHNDMEHLQELLEKYSGTGQQKFILTESVFSMDGDIAPLEKIYTLAKKYDCFTIIDEAHSTGVLGTSGQGLAKQADLVIGTFSKAFGSFGAYIACSNTIKNYLINKCSGIIYATALPPTILGSIDAALDLIPMMDKEREYLKNLSQKFRDDIISMGYNCGKSQTQIVPIIIGDAQKTIDMSTVLKEHSLWVSAIRPPTVPPNTARLRFAFSSTHTENDLDKLTQLLKKAA